MLKLFVSYRSLDSAQVDKIVALLRSLEKDGGPLYSVWQDKQDIPGGADWFESIIRAIIDCDVILFCLSREALKSPVCRTELNYAFRRGRPIIPIVLEGEYQLNPKTGKNALLQEITEPEELLKRRAQYLFYEETSFLARFEQAIAYIQSDPSRWIDHDIPYPGDEDSMNVYAKACDHAHKAEFEEAVTLFQKLTRRGATDFFFREANQWMDVLGKYQALAAAHQPQMHFHFNRLWLEYISLFPLPFIEGVFNPNDFEVMPPPALSEETFLKMIRGCTAQDFEICYIPDDGPFFYGAATPPRQISLPAFVISKYPITYGQFQKFYESEFDNPLWWAGWEVRGMDYKQRAEPRSIVGDHPRDNLSWFDAMAFCRWLSYQLGRPHDLDHVADWAVRLPTEYEWEKAARGRRGFLFPYGTAFDATKSNTDSIHGPTPVTRYPAGQSEYGVMDMSGNVWEWCLSDFLKPRQNPAKEVLRTKDGRVMRGGSWANPDYDSRAVYRKSCAPVSRSHNFGFRVVCVF